MNNKLTFVKPLGWSMYPLYKKIKYYASIIDYRYSIYVDKIEAKKIVNYLTKGQIKTAKIIKILENQDDITEEDINENHIIKATNGCARNIDLSIFIKDNNNNNNSNNLDLIKNKIKDFYNTYGLDTKENQYKWIKPRVFIEEKIYDKRLGKTGNADVYMIRCIKGNPVSIGYKMMEEDINLLFDLNWNLIAKAKSHDTIKNQDNKINNKILLPNKPKKLNEMLKYARILSSRFEFVRIDYYIDENDELYFSEFTFTPAGGNKVFEEDTEYSLGLLWK